MAIINFGRDGLNATDETFAVPASGQTFYFINETEHTIRGTFEADTPLSFANHFGMLEQIGTTNRYNFVMEGGSVIQFTVANADTVSRNFVFNMTNNRIGNTHGTPLGGRVDRSSFHGNQNFIVAIGV